VNGGAPVVLLSGWGTGGEAWDPVLPGLGGGLVRPLAWHEADEGDGRGLSELLSSEKEPWVVAGWSLGALLALRGALAQPSRVAALVLVSATARLCRDGDWPGADPRAVRAMRGRLPADRAAVLEGFADLCARPDGGDAARERFLDGARRHSLERLSRGLSLLASLDLRARAGEVAVPVTLLHGGEDGVVPAGSARALSALLPRARLDVVAGRGHALPWTDPGRVARAVREARR